MFLANFYETWYVDHEHTYTLLIIPFASQQQRDDSAKI
jgi:hypothetical protein